MLRQIGARNSMREMSTNEILDKGLREELKDTGRSIAVYAITSAITMAAAVKEEYTDNKCLKEIRRKLLNVNSN